MQTDACIEHLQKTAFRKKVLWLRIWKHGATLKKCFFAHTFRCAWKSWRTVPCSAMPSGAGSVRSAQGTNSCEEEWRWMRPCGDKADTQRVAASGSRCAISVLTSLGSVVCNVQTRNSVRTMHGVRMGSSWRVGGAACIQVVPSSYVGAQQRRAVLEVGSWEMGPVYMDKEWKVLNKEGR